MSSATNSRNYLSRGVRPAAASKPSSPFTTFIRSVWRLRARLSFFNCPKKKKKNVKIAKSRRVAHGLTSPSPAWSIVSSFQRRSTKGAEFVRSGSARGLSSPMLVVISLSCHCSLLCSPSFLIILSAIYQTMKSERNKKKIELVVSLHYGLCQVFWGKMFCVFSLSVP